MILFSSLINAETEHIFIYMGAFVSFSFEITWSWPWPIFPLGAHHFSYWFERDCCFSHTISCKKKKKSCLCVVGLLICRFLILLGKTVNFSYSPMYCFLAFWISVLCIIRNASHPEIIQILSSKIYILMGNTFVWYENKNIKLPSEKSCYSIWPLQSHWPHDLPPPLESPL